MQAIHKIPPPRPPQKSRDSSRTVYRLSWIKRFFFGENVSSQMHDLGESHAHRETAEHLQPANTSITR